MKKFIIFQMLLCTSWLCLGQPIPYGQSQETFVYYQDQTTSVNLTIGYYKPANYDSLNSEIILYCHGQGGNQNEGYNLLNQLSDKRKALIVSPTSSTAPWSIAGLISPGTYEIWLPNVFKEIYKHILQRESRNSINVRLIGFSAGGQCVTRYMLIRQGINDSIPIKMAISINPYFYAFPTDTLDGLLYSYPWGIAQHPLYYMGSVCDEHIKGYFNENYTVLIGTADTVNLNDTWPEMLAQGTNRYDRAVNFYNFSLQVAVNNGTTLKWDYAEVPNVAHDGYAMINTKASPTDTVTICEHYLFDMPYHEPQKYPPTADFDYFINDTTQCVEFNADCKCWWQIQPTTYTWDFGNGITATGQNVSIDLSLNGQYNVQLIASNIYGSDTITKNIEISVLPVADFSVSDSILVLPNNTVTFTFLGQNADSVLWNFGDETISNLISPVHSYQDTGSYTTTLYVYNQNNCVDSIIKLIKVKNYNSVNLLSNSKKIEIYPNPTRGEITIKSENEAIEAIESIEIYNCTGKIIDAMKLKNVCFSYLYIADNLNGLFFVKIKTNKNVYLEKIVFK